MHLSLVYIIADSAAALNSFETTPLGAAVPFLTQMCTCALLDAQQRRGTCSRWSRTVGLGLGLQ